MVKSKISIPLFIDFEASSLRSSSYPIEVAWSNSDGSVESHLISPEGISHWTDWSKEAEAVHGIRRDELLQQGKSPLWVCKRMNERLEGQILYSDNPDYDGHWLNELFSASYGMKPAFTLGDVDALLVSIVCPEREGRSDGLRRIEAMKRLARREVMGQHRAAWDVEYLVKLFLMAKEYGEKNRS